jgi:triphosphoribosyl-dephospho-CoA synthase
MIAAKPFDRPWSISQAVQLAMILEATAPKLGNVHPTACFADMQYGHFLSSAMAAAPVFDQIEQQSVGSLFLRSVRAVSLAAECNTSLGILLLIAPLAKAASRMNTAAAPNATQPDATQSDATQPEAANRLRQAAEAVLAEMTAEDSRDVYCGIRLAQPGGLGSQDENDVAGQAPEKLVEAMRQVADFDATARQYVNGFADIFGYLLPWLNEELGSTRDPVQAIVRLQLRWLAREPDGLIVRKLGLESAKMIQQRCVQVWNSVLTDSDGGRSAMKRLDGYLREDGNRRNPGTTADLIAATLFCKLLLS